MLQALLRWRFSRILKISLSEDQEIRLPEALATLLIWDPVQVVLFLLGQNPWELSQEELEQERRDLILPVVNKRSGKKRLILSRNDPHQKSES
jgi:hypothetical protein